MKKQLLTLLLLSLLPTLTLSAQEASTPEVEATLARYTRILNGFGNQPDPAFARLSHHYLKRMNTFAEESPITSQDIVMLGNSLTEGGRDWGAKLPETHRRVVNRGIVGDTTSGILMRLSDITARRPAQIFLLIGVNDLQVGREPAEIIKNIETIIARIKVESPTTKLVVQTLLPIDESTGEYKYLRGKSHLIPEINEGIAQLAEKYDVALIDLYPHFLDPATNALPKSISRDGLHLTADGYKIWSKQLVPQLLK
ncbi:MAG: GDSL-type esterase/lipase family protein [Porphyromonas sp.]|nr:GDSL-type esterase/lipase family protein [Porphyromonas sp.]